MRRIYLLTAIILILHLVACEGRENIGYQKNDVTSIEFENSVGHVSYEAYEFTRTEFGTDIVIIYFSFTNNSNEYQCLHDVAHFQAYQDGVEIDGCQLDSEEGENSWREIEKGKTLDCAIAFKASDKENVHLRVSAIIDGCFDSSIYQEQIFECR